MRQEPEIGVERCLVDCRSCWTWRECDAPGTMLKLAVAVVAIALADSVNPSLIGGELFVATGEHPRRQTTAFTAAALIVTFVFGFALAARTRVT